MRRYRNLALAYLLGVISMSACASVSYRYYTLNLPVECYDKGQLFGKLGKDGWPDLPLKTCEPDAVNQGKCVAMLTPEYISMRKDLEECHVALDQCQRHPPSELEERR